MPDFHDPNLSRWFTVKNAETEEAIPAFAVVRITGVDAATGAVTVAKPDAASCPLIAFNGETEIPVGGFGQATQDLPARALYDDAAGVPAAADPPQPWGTAADSWKLVKDNRGVYAWGNLDSDGDVGLFGRAMVWDVTFNNVACEIVATYGGI